MKDAHGVRILMDPCGIERHVPARPPAAAGGLIKRSVKRYKGDGFRWRQGPEAVHFHKNPEPGFLRRF